MSRLKTMKRLKLSPEDKAQKQVAFSNILLELESVLKDLPGVDSSEAEEWDIDSSDMDGYYPSMTLSVRYYGSWDFPDDEWSCEPVLKNKDGMAINKAFSALKEKYNAFDMYWKASEKSCLYFTVRPIPETE